jgi:hypothetical protein
MSTPAPTRVSPQFATHVSHKTSDERTRYAQRLAEAKHVIAQGAKLDDPTAIVALAKKLATIPLSVASEHLRDLLAEVHDAHLALTPLEQTWVEVNGDASEAYDRWKHAQEGHFAASRRVNAPTAEERIELDSDEFRDTRRAMIVAEKALSAAQGRAQVADRACSEVNEIVQQLERDVSDAQKRVKSLAGIVD